MLRSDPSDRFASPSFPPLFPATAYLCASGCVPGKEGAVPVMVNCLNLARLALLMQDACVRSAAPDGSGHLSQRVGLHAGPVVAGVVGMDMLR